VWILVNQQIPVQEEYRPQFMGIYWAVWWIEGEHVKKEFIKYLRLDEEFDARTVSKIKSIPSAEFQNPYQIPNSLGDEFKESFQRFKSMDLSAHPLGLSPNPSKAVRVMVNGEAVKLWPHEYSMLEADKMLEFINEGLYELQSGDVAEETVQEYVIKGIAKEIYEAAILDGCSDFEAKLVAIGVDVSSAYQIPPVGWYKYVGPECFESMRIRKYGLSLKDK